MIRWEREPVAYVGRSVEEAYILRFCNVRQLHLQSIPIGFVGALSKLALDFRKSPSDRNGQNKS